MSPEDFVTYEQAQALKRLGFRENCLYYYYNGTLYSNDVYNAYSSLHKVEALYMVHNIAKELLIYDAPTLWDAQKWLIKEKKYYVNPDADVSDCWFWEIVNLRNSDLVCMWNLPNQPNHYSSYEEALSAGITETLKILEENESKSNKDR